MSSKKTADIDLKINQGFQLKDLFVLVKSVEDKALKGDKKSISILKEAAKRWEMSSGYVS